MQISRRMCVVRGSEVDFFFIRYSSLIVIRSSGHRCKGVSLSAHGVGRGAGVGRGLGVGLHLPVHGVGVGVGVDVAVGVGDAVGVGLGVGLGGGPDCAQYLPPVFV